MCSTTGRPFVQNCRRRKQRCRRVSSCSRPSRGLIWKALCPWWQLEVRHCPWQSYEKEFLRTCEKNYAVFNPYEKGPGKFKYRLMMTSCMLAWALHNCMKRVLDSVHPECLTTRGDDISHSSCDPYSCCRLKVRKYFANVPFSFRWHIEGGQVDAQFQRRPAQPGKLVAFILLSAAGRGRLSTPSFLASHALRANEPTSSAWNSCSFHLKRQTAAPPQKAFELAIA